MTLIAIPNVFCGTCRMMLSVTYSQEYKAYTASHGRSEVRPCVNDDKIWEVETKLNAQELNIREIKPLPILAGAERKIRA